MVRQIAPDSPRTPSVLRIDRPKIDFSMLRDMADAHEKSAIENYNLYAKTAWHQTSNAIYNNNKSDPLAVAALLGKAAENMLPNDMPQDIRNKFLAEFSIDAMGFVSKAETNRQEQIDLQNQQMVQANVADLTSDLENDYMGLLRYNMSPAEQKRPIDVETYNAHALELANLANFRDSSGKYLYSESERRNLIEQPSTKLNGAKKFFDNLILQDAEQAKDYYEKFILQPTEYMEQSRMSRDTYETFKKYAEQQLKNYDQDIENSKFNRTVLETLALTVDYSDEKYEKLRDSKLDDGVLKKLKKETTKFNQYNGAQAISPEAMFVALDNARELLDNTDYTPAGREKALSQYATALEETGRWADENGLSESDSNNIRKMLVRAAADAGFADILRDVSSLNDILQVSNVGAGGLSDAVITATNYGLGQENNTRAVRAAQDTAVKDAKRLSEAVMTLYASGQPEKARQLLQQGRKQVIRDKYSWFVSPTEFDRLESALKNNEPALINRYGLVYEFQGYGSTKPNFKVKL